MKGYIPRTDSVGALRKLVEVRGRHLCGQEFHDLLEYGAWKCVLFALTVTPTLACTTNPWSGNTPLHILAEMGCTLEPHICDQLVGALVAAGGSMQVRDADDMKPIARVWFNSKMRDAKTIRRVSELFIDYGAWPIAGHKPTLADWEHRIRAFKVRTAMRVVLFWALKRVVGVPRDVARIIVQHPVLLSVHAWREWK